MSTLRSRTALVLASTLLALCGCQGPTASARTSGPPNVVLILTDDQGWGDIRSHGNPDIDTPHLDRLARQGARFDRFFVSSVCAPTRASLLTGRYHLRTGTHGVTRGREAMRASEITLAEVLRDAGYRTAAFGKWHNGRHHPRHPRSQGFDHFTGFCAGHWNNYFDTPLESDGEEIGSDGYIIDDLTTRSLDFIRESADRPFFLYLPYNTPHTPWQVPDRPYYKYKSRGLDDATACAFAMCENIDDNVGRVMATLEELELLENTIVIFLTDNGPNTDRFNGGMRGRKGSVHEGGVRVPFFISWPGKIPAGREVSRISAHIDVLPTLAELCGAKLPDVELDGRSLVPLLLEDEPDWPSRTLYSFRSRGDRPHPHLGAVRTDRYRAVIHGRPGQWELYDLESDPGQKRNLASEMPDLTRELAGRFEKMFGDVTAAGFERLPISLGVPGHPLTHLPGHEADLSRSDRKGIRYLGRNGWANDFITGWTDREASASWPVRVEQGGRYRVEVDFIATPGQFGSRLEISVGEASLEHEFARAHHVPDVPSPDRVARKEVYERVWARDEAGTLELSPGPSRLVLRAKKISGDRMPDIKAVRVERIGPSDSSGR